MVFLEFLQREGVDTLFCFVNDGSYDETGRLLEEMAGKSKSILLIDRTENRGKAESVREGALKLLEETDCEWVGFWDADLATPLNEIPLFKKCILERPYLGVVTGARILRLGANIVRHWYRHYFGRIFATFASLALGLPVYDTQCGAKLFRRDLASEIFAESFLSRWLFDVELLFRIQKTALFKSQGVQILYELPLHNWEDVAGSRLKSSDFLKAPLELLKIKRKYDKC